MTTFDYDLFVIGAGSGGVRAARVAAETGANVAIAEEYRFGGTCVIRGCVPKKLMVYASSFSEHFEDAAGFGWHVGDSSFSWEKLITAKDKEIDRLEGIYQRLLNNSGVTVHASRAIIKDTHTVTLADGTNITAKHILIATGGTPFVPDIKGAEHVITSNEVFNLKQQPKRIAIVGGGYIASEFAGIFNGLGSEVTQIYRGDMFLRGFDDDVRTHMATAMRGRGVNLHFNTDIQGIDKQNDILNITLNDGSSIQADCVLYATGRVPNTSNMGLQENNVKLGRKGEIAVDEYSQTSIPSIFAVGDVTDRMALTPIAIREGMAFVETVFKSNPTPVDHRDVATAVFTQPEIGTVGLTEEEARKEHKVDIYRAAFRPMLNTLSGRDEQMLMKLIVDRASDKVLGVHIIGHGAGEMIQMAGIAVRMGATKADFDRTVAVHPTASEELVTMKTPV